MGKVILLSFFLFNGTAGLLAQSFQISGIVTNEKTKEPIPLVSVEQKNINVGTITQGNGEYSIEAGNSDTLVFSCVGYKEIIVPVGGRTHIDVEMVPDTDDIHVTLVCDKNYFEPGLITSTYFPYGATINFLSHKSGYCCATYYRINVGLHYGTNSNSNEIFNSRVGLDRMKTGNVLIGITMNYNRFKLRVDEKNFLISDYRFKVNIDQILNYFGLEAGSGKQTFNNSGHLGLGGKLYVTNGFGDLFPKLRWNLSSEFWRWQTYNEFAIGFDLLYLNADNFSSRMRNVALGCKVTQIDQIRFFSISTSFKLVVKKQYKGCV